MPICEFVSKIEFKGNALYILETHSHTYLLVQVYKLDKYINLSLLLFCQKIDIYSLFSQIKSLRAC